MADCCLPNLGCLSIPIVSTNVDGPPGPAGAAGRGIVNEFYEPSTGELTLTFTDNTTYTTSDLRGQQGLTGAQGVNGVSRLYSMPIDFFSATLVNQWVQMHDYTVAANTLVNNGDSLVVSLRSSRMLNSGNSNFQSLRRIRWNNLYMSPSTGVDMTQLSLVAGVIYQYNVKVEMIKTDVDKAICLITGDYGILPQESFLVQLNLTGLDFTDTNYIYTDLWQIVVSQTYFNSITIDKITKQ